MRVSPHRTASHRSHRPKHQVRQTRFDPLWVADQSSFGFPATRQQKRKNPHDPVRNRRGTMVTTSPYGLGQVLGDDISNTGHQDAARALGLLALDEAVLESSTRQSLEISILHRLGSGDDEVLIETVAGQGGEVVLLHGLLGEFLLLGVHTVQHMFEGGHTAEQEEPDHIGARLVLQVHTKHSGRGHLHGDMSSTPTGLLAANRHGPRLGAVNEDGDRIRARTVVRSSVERIRTGLAVGEEAHIDNLQLVVTLELLGERHHRVHGFVKRRTTEAEPMRDRAVAVRLIGRSDGEQHTGASVELHLGHLAREDIQEVKRIEAHIAVVVVVTLLVLLVFLADRLAGLHTVLHLTTLEVDIGVARVVRIAEQIHLERDVDGLAEQDQVEQLVDRVLEFVTHRAAPIHAEDHAVVLTLGDLLGGEEDIIRELVIVDTIHVDDTAASRTSAARLVSSHLHLKLLHEHLDGIGRVAAEILEHLLAGVGTSALGDSGELRVNGLVTNHDAIHVHSRHLPTTNLRSRSVNHRLLRLLFSFARHRLGGLTRGVAGRRRLALRLLLIVGGRLAVAVVLRLAAVLLLLAFLRHRVIVTGAVGGIVTLTLTGRFAAGVVGTLRLTLRTVLLLLLLLLRFLTRTIVLVHLGSEGDHIFPGLHRFKTRKECSFVSSHRHGSDAVDARLEVQVHTVEQRETSHLLCGHVLDAEEVTVEQILARFSVATLEAGEAILHLAVDANIFHDIQVVMDHESISLTIRIDSGVGLTDNRHIARSVQRVTNLVGAEHIVDITRHFLPHGKREDASAGIERCGLRRCIMDDRDVLGGEQAREGILGGGVDGERVRNGRGSVSHSAPIVPNPSG